MSAPIGASLALAVGIFATLIGLDRERAFYPTVTIVIGAGVDVGRSVRKERPPLEATSMANGTTPSPLERSHPIVERQPLVLAQRGASPPRFRTCVERSD